jgi:hypothetical protein
LKAFFTLKLRAIYGERDMLAGVDERAVNTFAKLWDAIPATSDRIVVGLAGIAAAVALAGIGIAAGRWLKEHEKPSDKKVDKPFRFRAAGVVPLQMNDFLALCKTFEGITAGRTAIQRGRFEDFFVGGKFEWTGFVADAESHSSVAAVRLLPSPGDRGYGFLFHFHRRQLAQLKALEIGSRVTIAGVLTKDGWFEDCQLVKVYPQETPADLKLPTVNASAPVPLTSDFFAGRWEILPFNGEKGWVLTLSSDKRARKSNERDVTGVWELVDNAARITWEERNGWKDMLRREPDGFWKLAFGKGKSWSDTPTNRQPAKKRPE